MNKINQHSPASPIKNDNLKNLKSFNDKNNKNTIVDKAAPELSAQAKNLNDTENNKTGIKENNSESALNSATNVVEKIAKAPILPIVVPKNSTSGIQKKLDEKKIEKMHFINEPAVIFIEGFSAFGISNGDGIKDMADNYPGAKLFSWDEKDKIINEIKKHKQDQPVVLVGHSFGGDTAVEIANELNSAKNSFHPIELLVSIDSVGLKNNIMPINVKRNLNFFEEGIVPFLHGSPNIARNTNYTEVTNELRSELHSKIDDSEEVQFKIFEEINSSLNSPQNNAEIVIQLNLDDLIGNSQLLEKK